MPTDPPSPLRRPMPLRDAVERLLDALPDGARLVLGIVGAPGAGKSAASDAVLAAAGQRGVSAVVVPMDGWHLAHAALEQRGLAAVKGAPETFDADGFVTLLRRLRAQSVDGPAVWAPEFRREIEELVAGAIEVRSDHRLVVVEGNYLLVQEEPWRDVAGLLDVVWYLAPMRTPDARASSPATRRTDAPPTPPERMRSGQTKPMRGGARSRAEPAPLTLSTSTPAESNQAEATPPEKPQEPPELPAPVGSSGLQ